MTHLDEQLSLPPQLLGTCMPAPVVPSGRRATADHALDSRGTFSLPLSTPGIIRSGKLRRRLPDLLSAEANQSCKAKVRRFMYIS